MKKYVVLTFVVLMALQLVSCGNTTEKNDNQNQQIQQQEQKQVQQQEQKQEPQKTVNVDSAGLARKEVEKYFREKCNKELADPASVVIHEIKLSRKENLGESGDLGIVYYARVDYSATNEFGGKTRTTQGYEVSVVYETGEVRVQERLI